MPDIDTLPAGREMDALVAERVMGLVPCQAECHDPDSAMYIPGPCHAYPDSPGEGGETALYSTDIAAAWPVFEKLQTLGCPKDAAAVLTLEYEPGRAWVSWQWHEAVYAPEAEADTAPLAICRAALKAVTYAP